jgi:hypothetical protein
LKDFLKVVNASGGAAKVTIGSMCTLGHHLAMNVSIRYSPNPYRKKTFIPNIIFGSLTTVIRFVTRALGEPDRLDELIDFKYSPSTFQMLAATMTYFIVLSQLDIGQRK